MLLNFFKAISFSIFDSFIIIKRCLLTYFIHILKIIAFIIIIFSFGLILSLLNIWLYFVVLLTCIFAFLLDWFWSKTMNYFEEL